MEDSCLWEDNFFKESNDNIRKCIHLKDRKEYLSNIKKGRFTFTQEFCRFCQEERKIISLNGIDFELRELNLQLMTGEININILEMPDNKPG